MNKKQYNITCKTGTRLYAVLLFASLMLPATANGQLFGGMIKAKKPIDIVNPSTITLAQTQNYFVASVYDQDYLPYTAPTGVATTTAASANGVNESVTVDVQGTITTTGVTVYIPATATGSGTLPAYSTTVTIPATLTEDGISRDLTLSWASQSYTSATTSITATIKTVGETLNALKLDINAGIGNNYLGVLLGQLVYPYNNAGDTTTYSVRVIPGIPDKKFGQYDLGNTTTYEHNFLYLPVTGEDGKIWLNNNLGAEYANVSSNSFNLAQQATAYNDYRAYGSLFQWGRAPDGHELIKWTNALAGIVKYGTTATNSNAPTSALFITETASPYDWRVTQDSTPWATEASVNNPCPAGYRVPVSTELSTIVSSAGITNYTTAASSKLHFSAPGNRNVSSGALGKTGAVGYYWSSSVSGSNASYQVFFSGSTNANTFGRAYGFSVRCLKN